MSLTKTKIRSIALYWSTTENTSIKHAGGRRFSLLLFFIRSSAHLNMEIFTSHLNRKEFSLTLKDFYTSKY